MEVTGNNDDAGTEDVIGDNAALNCRIVLEYHRLEIRVGSYVEILLIIGMKKIHWGEERRGEERRERKASRAGSRTTICRSCIST